MRGAVLPFFFYPFKALYMNNYKFKIMDILTIKTKEGEKEVEKTYSFSIFGVVVLSILLGGIFVNVDLGSKG